MSFRARQIAEAAHSGQFSEDGVPTIDRTKRICAAVVGIPEKIVALLHDVVGQRGGWTLEQLRVEGFSDEIIEAIDAMNRRKGEEYFCSILRARANTIAQRVKVSVLEDDVDQMRTTFFDWERERRFAQRVNALRILQGNIER